MNADLVSAVAALREFHEKLVADKMQTVSGDVWKAWVLCVDDASNSEGFKALNAKSRIAFRKALNAMRNAWDQHHRDEMIDQVATALRAVVQKPPTKRETPPEHKRRMKELKDAGFTDKEIATKVSKEFGKKYTAQAVCDHRKARANKKRG